MRMQSRKRQSLVVSQPLPARALVAEVKCGRMQDLRQDLQRLDQAWPWSVEELIAIEQIDTSLAHRLQLVPTRSPGQERHFLPGAGDVEAARQHQDHVRILRHEILPGQPRRVLARLAEQVDPTSHPYQLWH